MAEELKKDIGILDALAAELDQGFQEETFKVAGIHWKLRTLNDGETNWVNQFVITTSAPALFQSLKAPTLAMAIRAIGKEVDGVLKMVPVEEYFLTEWERVSGTPDEQVRRLLRSNNALSKQYFFAEKLLDFLIKRPSTGKDGSLVEQLWKCYAALSERRDQAQEAMGKFLGAAGISETPMIPGLPEFPRYLC